MTVESIDDIIKLSGDIKSNQWQAIRTAAGLLLKRHPNGVVVDCSGLNSITEEGAQTFYDMMRHIQSKHARIIVANVPKHVKEVIAKVPDIRSGLAIAETVEDARQSLELLSEIREDKKKSPHTKGIVLLCLSGSASDSCAISLASAVAEKRQLSMLAVYPIIVPRTMPTDTPMPEEEDKAAQALQKVAAILEHKDFSVEPEVVRARNNAAAIMQVAEKENVRIIVIALPEEDPQTNEPTETIQEILDKIKTEIVLVREPRK